MKMQISFEILSGMLIALLTALLISYMAASAYLHSSGFYTYVEKAAHYAGSSANAMLNSCPCRVT